MIIPNYVHEKVESIKEERKEMMKITKLPSAENYIDKLNSLSLTFKQKRGYQGELITKIDFYISNLAYYKDLFLDELDEEGKKLLTSIIETMQQIKMKIKRESLSEFENLQICEVEKLINKLKKIENVVDKHFKYLVKKDEKLSIIFKTLKIKTAIELKKEGL